MLHEFIAANRPEIITRCRTKVARRCDPPPTPAEVEHGVPVFLDQLVDLMRRGEDSSADISATAVMHGSDVTEFGRKQEKIILNHDADASELVDLVSTAILAFNVLRTGNVGVGGSTGRVLDRSLTRLAPLVTRLLGKVTTSETAPKH